MSSTLKTLLLWTVIFLVVILLWTTFQAGRVTRHELSFSEFLDNVSSGRVKEVTVRGQEWYGRYIESLNLETGATIDNQKLTPDFVYWIGC